MLLLLTTTSLFLLVALSNHEHAKLIDAFAPTSPSNSIQPPQQRATRTTTATRKLHSTFQTTTHEESSTKTTVSNTDDLSTVSNGGCNNHQNAKTSNWFPVKPVDALSPSNGYDTIVKSAYLRHILVSSEEMADLIMDIYLKGGKLTAENDDDGGNTTTYHYGPTDGDVFTRLAKDVSLCISSREEGGKIGWVDNPNNNNNNNNNNINKGEILNSVVHDMIDPNVIERVFEQSVKGGDVLKLPATTKQEQHDNDDNDNVSSTMWHIIRVDDLYIDIQPSTMIPTTADATADTRSKNVINKTRNKLKGVGTIPLSPTFSKRLLNNDGSSNNIVETDNNIQSSLSKNIYTVPNAKYYKIVTTGCQMNVADSERIMGILENELGLQSLDSSSVMDKNNNNDNIVKEIVGSSSSDDVGLSKSSTKKKTTSTTPDILLLNTCTIRDHAEQKVYDALGPYTSLKRAGHPIAIVVAGCVAQQEGENLLRRFPEIDLVLGPQYIPWLGNLLVEVGKGSQLCMTEPMIWSESSRNRNDDDSSQTKDGEWMTPVKREHTTRAWVNVIYGCNEHCTYCVVPSVRGVEQSRSMEAILAECTQLANLGYKEVTLLGQNIDAYGRDQTPKRTFADLLHYLNDNLPPTLSRIRYVTSHPRYFSERVIDAVAELDKVCECFHVPFQAGDDTVLRNMRRGYTYDSYMNIIHKIRDKAPDASICGDVIVGFAGETEEQFQRTLDLMNEVKFDNLNTFAYSPRPNTEAANWDNHIPPDVQSDRLQRVQALAAEHALERSQRYLGREVEVLVEDRNPKNGEEVMGRTRQGRQVFFPGNVDKLKGELVMVEILEARTWSLIGKISVNVPTKSTDNTDVKRNIIS